MSLEILNLTNEELDLNLSKLTNRYSKVKETDIGKKREDNIDIIFSTSNLIELAEKLNDPEFRDSISFEKLSYIVNILDNATSNLKKQRDESEVELFIKEGYDIDIAELRNIWEKKKLFKQFPNLKFIKIKQLYKNPPANIKVDYGEEEIEVDPFVFRKYLIAFIQMIFNEMDLLVVTVGGEGTGKSLKTTQDIKLSYFILSEIGVIDYKFDIKEIMFNNIKSFIEAEDKYFNEKFRLLALDEGNELNRQNWKDDLVNTFFQRLRRERFNQRIKWICLPVLGELITNIVMSRVNFIFECKTKNKVKTGTLNKGLCNMYIIPRNDEIYSTYHKRNLTKDEIKQTLYENLKDKSYLKGMPKSILTHEFNFNGVWGFDPQSYVESLKQTNETFSVNRGLLLSETELFYLYKVGINLKRLGVNQKDIMYNTLAKIKSKVNNYFEKDLEKLEKFDIIYRRKLEQRDNSNGEEVVE